MTSKDTYANPNAGKYATLAKRAAKESTARTRESRVNYRAGEYELWLWSMAAGAGAGADGYLSAADDADDNFGGDL